MNNIISLLYQETRDYPPQQKPIDKDVTPLAKLF